MMKKKINLALQVLPRSKSKHTYDIVDKAIEVIDKSGLPYKVCPFETVIEGEYDECMKVVGQVHEICYANETDEMMTYIKIQSSGIKGVTIADKMEKYE